MSIYLTGTRHCESCRTPARTSNAFTNGIGWRELCDRCTCGVQAFPHARPALALAGAAQ